MTTFADVKTWIITESTGEELELLQHSIKSREQILVSQIEIGDQVKVQKINPKCFEGLTGSLFKKNSGRSKRVAVKLDKASTTILRAAGSNRVHIPKEVEEHVLTGIPLTCLVKVS